MVELTTGNWITIALVLVNVGVTVLMKVNDLKHVEENQKVLMSKVDDTMQRLSRLEGVCSLCATKKLGKQK